MTIEQIADQADFNQATATWLNAHIEFIRAYEPLLKLIDKKIATFTTNKQFEDLIKLFPLGSLPYSRVAYKQLDWISRNFRF